MGAAPHRHGPLAGLKIIELAGLGPGPMAAMLLADLGADIIRIDRPGATPPAAPDPVMRGRPTLSLDLKTPAGRDALLDLVGDADALIEGFRPGVMERLGLGPDLCLARNPRLIFARMTGWGQTGPLAHTAGHDINYIALAGVLGRIGRPGERPVPPLNLVGDYGGGALYLAFGIMCALWEARGSGRGQVLDVAMVDGAASLMAKQFGLHAAGQLGDRGTNLLDGGAYFYDTYECADGRYVAVGAIEPQFHAALLQVLDIPADTLPPQWDQKRWPEARTILARRILARTRDEWASLAEGTDACLTPVLDLAEAAAHPHARARQAFSCVAGSPQPSPAPRFSRTPGEVSATARPASTEIETVKARWSAPQQGSSE
ncbi:alpha-methylacyl-CoA racemase [Rhodoligotrophos appendicifer]|uniref:CaiB/BaiF CoA transferase family protein n=1 Tax=Rhodoligotrophos appendicifer TaxID=987056 RepID=UPI00117E4A6B|nr:CaiB/BaiF CoA-transferase family protein [Rhodoligotrophos appendicifer]